MPMESALGKHTLGRRGYCGIRHKRDFYLILGSLLTCGTIGECTPWEMLLEKREQWDSKAAAAAVAEQPGKERANPSKAKGVLGV